MLKRAWQSAMIGLARSPVAGRFMQANRATSSLASKYVAGQTAAQGVKVAEELLSPLNLRSSLFYLGEYVSRVDLVAENVANKLAVARALGERGLDVHVSVDPTQIGQSVDRGLAHGNALRIAEEIRTAAGNRSGMHCLMFDMEDASVVDTTIALHDELRGKGLPVALTLQAYLRRTVNDMRAQIRAGSRVRLVKGAFAADSGIAYTREIEIKASFRSLVEMMLSAAARDQGFYPVFATHDDRLQRFAVDLAGRNGWKPGQYEFEMLLGVRSQLAHDLARRGERVRLYLPFGRDWWPYAVRRIGENPRNAMLLARSLVGSAGRGETRAASR
jgi:proline dehydrogenase